jgi:hypothetical protein
MGLRPLFLVGIFLLNVMSEVAMLGWRACLRVLKELEISAQPLGTWPDVL